MDTPRPPRTPPTQPDAVAATPTLQASPTLPTSPTLQASPTRQPSPAYGLQAHGSPWWKGVLSLVVLAVAYLAVSVALMIPASLVGNMLGLQGPINASTMAALNLSWAAMILVAPVVMRWIHGVPKGAFGSVHGGLRWGRLFRSLAWVVPLYAAANVLFYVVGPDMPRGAITAAHLTFGAVVLLTTPLQAAGEEYAFRGAAASSAATWAKNPRTALIIAAVISSLVFGVAHGATDPWLMLYYPAFGLGCWIMTRLTGGLENAIAVHAVNNVLSFLVALAFGTDLSTMFDRSAGKGGPFMLAPIAVMALACVITWVTTRRRARNAS